MSNKISCDAHDYFEIVCMRRSLIKVKTKDNKIYHGRAADLKLVQKQEYLQIDDGIHIQKILISEVTTLEALGNSISQHNFTITWQ
ncbi:Rho-binding antiterminator [Shewanella frigidimarina]|uniref:Rho-binding antiterminator n=1 Tax=Shewanella frigidimarina TaxID=56812 RepID=UPI003D7AFE60